MSLLSWFQKAKAIPAPAEGDAVDPATAAMQGSYTDHHESAYAIRQKIAPLHGDELEAFDWVLDKLAKENPKARQSELIDLGFDEGWFVEGKRGELRVSQEAPNV